MTLKFSDLLAKALLEWPTEIRLEPLRTYGSDSTRYTVDGLAEISDAIEAQHIGVADEIIMRCNLRGDPWSGSLYDTGQDV
jgi:hypothetical protein